MKEKIVASKRKKSKFDTVPCTGQALYCPLTLNFFFFVNLTINVLSEAPQRWFLKFIFLNSRESSKLELVIRRAY